MGELKRVLVDLSDEVWARTRRRVDGLVDDEYLWEPVPGCWTIRARSDGSWTTDSTLPPPDPPPFTTIALRMWHLIDMYGEDRAPQWLHVEPQGLPVGLDDPNGEPPATAALAIALLEQAHDRWDAHLVLVTDDELTEPLGDVAGPQYAERSRAAYVLHMLDEFIHHGAEIALLRDLWRWRHTTIDDDPVIDRVIRGDLGVLDELDGPPSARLLDRAAAFGRWELVVGLVERGATVTTTGRSPLHVAAGAGQLEVVRTLLAHGADPTATDPDYDATPEQWARFLGHDDLADELATHLGD